MLAARAVISEKPSIYLNGDIKSPAADYLFSADETISYSRLVLSLSGTSALRARLGPTLLSSHTGLSPVLTFR